ncbi:MAG: AtpZ/AtpI family protein [Phycisphaerales bacterium]|nr:AtpZ/AtpI family protein [Phycisphaerales bacterium]
MELLIALAVSARSPDDSRELGKIPVGTIQTMDSNHPSSPEIQSAASLWRLSAMGFTMACEIIAGLGLGWLLDLATGTDKVFLVIGTIMGVLVGLTGFLKTAIKANRNASRQIAQKHRPKDPSS